MSKKNIGAALSVIAASAAVATAYATTVTDLENDKHTNSLITEEDKGVDTSYSFVKSDYTKEVKNTKIAGSTRDSKKASQEIKKDIIIEKTAKTLVDKQIIDAEKKAEAIADEDEVVVYDDKDLDEIIEEKAQAEEQEVVVYDNQNIDEAVKEQVATYEENTEENTEVTPVAMAEEIPAPEDYEAPVVSDKFVNTASLNIRASKDATSSDNIVRTINAGDKLVGHVEGDWFVTNEGYVSLDYLSNYYPQDLVNKINAEAEAKRAQEAKAAEEARLAEEQRKAEEANAAEAARLAEEQRLAEEAQKQQVKETVQEVEKVVEEQAMDAPAPTGQGAQGAVNVASQFIGYSYVWGASDPNVGFDCSGLTSYAYRQVGVNLPHNSAAQFNNGYAVDTNNLKPGDLVFFSFGGGGIDHVGMITSSDGSFIHASTPQTGVRYDNIFNGSYQTAFRGARRIY